MIHLSDCRIPGSGSSLSLQAGLMDPGTGVHRHGRPLASSMARVAGPRARSQALRDPAKEVQESAMSAKYSQLTELKILTHLGMISTHILHPEML